MKIGNERKIASQNKWSLFRNVSENNVGSAGCRNIVDSNTQSNTSQSQWEYVWCPEELFSIPYQSLATAHILNVAVTGSINRLQSHSTFVRMERDSWVYLGTEASEHFAAHIRWYEQYVVGIILLIKSVGYPLKLSECRRPNHISLDSTCAIHTKQRWLGIVCNCASTHEAALSLVKAFHNCYWVGPVSTSRLPAYVRTISGETETWLI